MRKGLPTDPDYWRQFETELEDLERTDPAVASAAREMDEFTAKLTRTCLDCGVDCDEDQRCTDCGMARCDHCAGHLPKTCCAKLALFLAERQDNLDRG